MFLKAAALTFLPMVLVGSAVMNSSVMLVNVDNEDVSITVPVPLALAQIGLAFAPAEVKRIDVPEIAQYWPYVERIIIELREAPDGVFVEVIDDGNEHVKVFKEDDLLKVEVQDGSREHVTVQIPFASMMAVVNAYDTEGEFFRTSRLVGALRAAPSGDLVRVVDGDEEVHIRMW